MRALFESPLTFRRNKARIWVINQNKQWSWMPKNCLIEELPTLLFTLEHEKEIRGFKGEVMEGGIGELGLKVNLNWWRSMVWAKKAIFYRIWRLRARNYFSLVSFTLCFLWSSYMVWNSNLVLKFQVSCKTNRAFLSKLRLVWAEDFERNCLI